MHQTMSHTYSATAMGQELRQFLRLGTPILIAEALHMSASFVDTIMAGRYSSADLAAVAVGSSLLFPVLILMMGTIMATTPTVAQYFGAKKTLLNWPFCTAIHMAGCHAKLFSRGIVIRLRSDI